jgi:thiamine biosynthesis lipoprotein
MHGAARGPFSRRRRGKAGRKASLAGLPACHHALRRGLCLLVASAGASVSAQSAAVLERSVYSMGTQLDLRVEGPKKESLVSATEAAVREAERIEAACSTWRPDSAWSRLNAAHGALTPIGEEWTRLLATVLTWTRCTHGAFDPVLGALIRTWGTRTGGRTPTAAELEAAREASGASLLRLGPIEGSAQLLHEGAALEEGGFLKGYALDRMAAELRRRGVTEGVLNFGGQVLAFGRPYRVGIAPPEARHQVVVEVSLHDASLSSSGTSEHGRHIIDPATGERCPAWGSVSVVAEDGLSADILSTALFVMGPEQGLRWANAHGVAALFQRSAGAVSETDAFRSLRVNSIAVPSPRGTP